MYRLARAGKIKNFTGIDDPYEPPLAPEIVIDGAARLAEDNADRIIAYLLEQRFILPTFNLTDEAQPILSPPAALDDDYSNRHS